MLFYTHAFPLLCLNTHYSLLCMLFPFSGWKTPTDPLRHSTNVISSVVPFPCSLLY